MVAKANLENMDTLNRITEYYKTTPWVGLLRALEVRKLREVWNLCAPPILDLGCGDGLVASLAFGSRLEGGIDVNINPLLKAAHAGRYQIVCQADAKRLPFKCGTFRTVYSNGSMEHMEHLRIVLQEVNRILLPGGKLITLVPSDRFLAPIGILGKAMGNKIWNAYNRLHNHVNLFSVAEWASYLQDHGFEVKMIQLYGGDDVANYLCPWDLLSKLSIKCKWPFFSLQHAGRLGIIATRMCSGRQRRRVKELFVREISSHPRGNWFMIVAEKRLEIRNNNREVC